jgi:hypothetical protein
MTCACEVIPNADEICSGGVSYEIIYCPKHAAVDDMLAALQEIEHDSWQMREYIACEVCQHCNATDREYLVAIRSKATAALEPIRQAEAAALDRVKGAS